MLLSSVCEVMMMSDVLMFVPVVVTRKNIIMSLLRWTISLWILCALLYDSSIPVLIIIVTLLPVLKNTKQCKLFLLIHNRSTILNFSNDNTTMVLIKITIICIVLVLRLYQFCLLVYYNHFCDYIHLHERIILICQRGRELDELLFTYYTQLETTLYVYA